MANSQLTEKQIAHAIELAKARTEYAKKHGSPQLNNEEEVTLIALREYQEYRKLLKAAERRITEIESRVVTVKLLKDHVDDADLFGWGVVVVPLEALKEACTDAGVTVEITDAGIKAEAE
ncbi:TPA: hypothetical protein MC769_003167 [Klebsiella aerogenes]|uniref:hypothetical protein n=1 Tax=Klebsiella aerogenes TaxID=548 RepID=UPI003CF2944B|nr:hypothetical protein [Klebsiella aerogenes]